MNGRARAERAVTRLWFDTVAARRPVARLLSGLLGPLSALTRYVAARNRQQVENGKRLRHQQHQRYPGAQPIVLVVGNLVVGGAGKTPLAIAIARHLNHALAGDAAATSNAPLVGLLCRGAGSQQVLHKPRRVTATSTAQQVGDEALLLAHATGLPVVCGVNRADAMALLLDQCPGLRVVLSDDGLQHTRLQRDIEIAVFDKRAIGNGRLLPAGPLREPLEHLGSIDAIVLNKGFADTTAPADTDPWRHMPGAARAHPYRFESTISIRALAPWREWQQRSPDAQTDARDQLYAFATRHAGERIAAVAGIASPNAFFDLLSAHGIAHTAYAPGDHAQVAATIERLDEPVILVTEKDAVKCPPDSRIYVLCIAANPSEQLLNWLIRKIHGFQAA